MQKGLCITALTISVIVFAIFLADLIFGLAGMANLKPFKYEDLSMTILDIVFVICALVLGILSWNTYKEQV